MKLLDIESGTLSEIVDLSQSSQGLAGTFASRWPALKDVPFFPAVGMAPAAI